MSRRILFPALCLIVPVLVVSAPADEWSRFRGPNGDGHGRADVPAKWSAKDFAWKAAVPGVGHSSPVVWRDRVFVTSGERKSGKWSVFCLSAKDGKTLWRRDQAGKAYKMHRSNSVASSTPAVDADRVYLARATPSECLVLAFDHAGEPLWQTPLAGYPSQHGFGVSLIVHDGRVIVSHQPDGDGAVFALDAATGKVKWRTPRKGKNATYATPCLFERGKSAELILSNWQHGLTGMDLATGKVTWELGVFDRETQMRVIASPVVAGDLVLGVCGFITGKKQLVAVRPPGPGGKGEAKEAWRLEQAVPQMATPLVKGNRVFLCTEQGMLSWLEADTGKVIWRQRVGGVFYASPIAIGETIQCVSTDGKVFVIAAEDRYRLVAQNDLGEASQSTPAVSGGRIYYRTEGHLMRLGK